MSLADVLCDPDARIVIAHRGNSAHIAENTLASLHDGMSLGADALEFDVRVTKDGVPVLLHDADLDRTTNGHGRLDAYTLAEVRTLNADPRGTRPGESLQIPTLDEVLDAFPRVPLVIEVKEVAAADLVERAVRRHGISEHVLVGSAETDASERLARSGLRTCASLREEAVVIPLALLGVSLRHPGYEALSIPPRYHGIPIPIAAMAATARKAGVATHVWTVNDPEQASAYWRSGVTGIITDDPAAIIRTRTR